MAPLRRVAMRRPGAILEADPQVWHYAKTPDASALIEQHGEFAALVEKHGAQIDWLSDEPDELADSVFTYDPSFVTGAGAIVMHPGKPLRVAEAGLHAGFYGEVGIPVIGTIEPPGLIEGGDCFFIDEKTLAVGRGFRTNQAGVDQLAAIVAPEGIELLDYDLPYFHGPEACLHLLSLVSPLADDLALIHAPLLPTALHEDLVTRGYTLLHAPPDEFDRSAGLNLNVLATAPRRCIAIEGFTGTLALMRDAGCEVDTFVADELCIPCEGGPTCLTRPLWRE